MMTWTAYVLKWFNSYYQKWVIVVHLSCAPAASGCGKAYFNKAWHLWVGSWRKLSRNWIWRTFVDNIHGSCTLDATSNSVEYMTQSYTWNTEFRLNFGCRTLKLSRTGNGTVKERISKLYLYIIHYLWAWLEPRRSKVFQKGQTAAMSQRSLPKPQIVLCPLSQNKRQQHAVWPSFSASWPEKMLRSTFKD